LIAAAYCRPCIPCGTLKHGIYTLCKVSGLCQRCHVRTFGPRGPKVEPCIYDCPEKVKRKRKIKRLRNLINDLKVWITKSTSIYVSACSWVYAGFSSWIHVTTIYVQLSLLRYYYILDNRNQNSLSYKHVRGTDLKKNPMTIDKCALIVNHDIIHSPLVGSSGQLKLQYMPLI